MLWFTSDLHFGHVRIIEYTGRPHAAWWEMDADMIARWNDVVGVRDDGLLQTFGANSISPLRSPSSAVPNTFWSVIMTNLPARQIPT